MLWIKALHIIAVICWFAALFYLPRLFVYHAMSSDEVSNERFKIMERKLYRGIATPSMIATLVFGAGLMHLQWDYLVTANWIWAKLAIVLALIGYHHMCGAHIKRFAKNANTHSDRYYRIFNELPVFALFAIVILAVVKPF
ncbi:protoporphyrinogen oxidase HemJ [Gilvimarinus sp. SDUM040013]|uniref:Protoporphyrinogen IX oxidase n=1 Tax=Gilvimarinus gilvus TaxID=3058038 RepID=A0ABU4RTZ2_9GAMM|nr:protoporphyrinogen oxidase HemJ [Gilvimarinus sp. SDUM040013]MDO3386717.1 protoporphyrinogen oxidase HemJ [Gilvimarinus sp. SDUM040013]MDX6848353.1 protoporphyrinogen oxidase HemJ [Gilvimarinus sp. SDUM040013]